MDSDQKQKKIDVKSCIDRIENEIYQILKPLGFRKHGRTLHRFVSGDISQVVGFQCGESYREETHLMWVRIGIRVPESYEWTFEPQKPKKFYHEYECNMRSTLGLTDQQELAVRANGGCIPDGTTYDLRNDLDEIIEDISRKIKQDVIPALGVLSSREAILAHRRDYPRYDTFDRQILLEEAMIYGRNHNIDKAKELFEAYYREAEEHATDTFVLGGELFDRKDATARHLEIMDELARKLGLRESPSSPS
jgi:hypothetical protein